MMGGDHGPLSTIPAAIEAVAEFPFLDLILCGDETTLTQALLDHHALHHPQLKIRHANSVVLMTDRPSVALRNKRDSSMRVALDRR